MSAAQKLRWARLVNELTYLHEEGEFLETINKSVASEFHEYYQDFCERLSIDIEALNRDNADRVRKIYGMTDASEGVEETKKALSDLQQQLATYTGPSVFPLDPESDEEPSPSEYEMTQDETELHEVFNKVFRKIAMRLHPDRLSPDLTDAERKASAEKFNTARKALEERKYFILLSMAKEMKIKTPRNYRQQIRWMKKEIGQLNNHINTQKSTYNYLFSECDTIEEKDRVIQKFIHHLFGINFAK